MKRFTWGWRRTNEAAIGLQMLLIVLELAGVTQWGWWAVFLPSLLAGCFVLLVALVASLVIVVDDL